VRLLNRHTLKAHDWSLSASVFSPDGSTIATVGRDTIRLWDADSRQLVRTLDEHPLVNGVAFSPDGQLLASTSVNGTLYVWEVASGNLRCTKNAYRMLEDCTFSPDGSFILTTDHENTLHRWNITCNQSDSGGIFVQENRDGYMHFCTISPDGKRTVYPRFFLGLQIWDLFTGETILTLDDHPGEVSSCSFSPDGQFVLAAGKDNLIWLWDAETGQKVNILSNHTGHVAECAFTPDGRSVVSVSKDQTLRLWSRETGEELGCLAFENPLTSLGLHPSAPRTVCGDRHGNLSFVEMIDFEYGPLIVTAHRNQQEIAVRCPACSQTYPIEEGQLDSVITCPTEGCGRGLIINPFIITMA
jgi:WD40 repeat protein